MKFGIDIGHNAPPDTGARGIIQEDVLTKRVGTRVIDKLRKLGKEVINCTPSRASTVVDSLSQRCETANFNKVDVYVSIHFNDFNGSADGTEIYVGGDAGARIARPILKNIAALGFRNRGIKDGSHLYVIRNTEMPAILIECCFCDSRTDMQLFDADKMSDAIVQGLTGQLPTPDSGKETSILKLQQALNRLKITDQNGKPLVEDGSLDPETTSAIQKFQSIVGIAATGSPDQTWEAINLILSKPILRPNHAAGSVVRYLQSRVGIDIDGIYGADTVDAVKKFQSENDLTADGIIGPQTWAKLIG